MNGGAKQKSKKEAGNVFGIEADSSSQVVMNMPIWGLPASISTFISKASVADAAGPLATPLMLTAAAVTYPPTWKLPTQGGGTEGAIGKVVSPEEPSASDPMLATSMAMEPST